jgi:hypothetical protein
MNIIFGRHNAEKLKDKHIVLELEDFDVENAQGVIERMPAFCVVPASMATIPELANMPDYVKMHEDLIESLKKDDWNFVRQAIPHLRDRFAGEMRSFYDEIASRDPELKEATDESN